MEPIHAVIILIALVVGGLAFFYAYHHAYREGYDDGVDQGYEDARFHYGLQKMVEEVEDDNKT